MKVDDQLTGILRSFIPEKNEAATIKLIKELFKYEEIEPPVEELHVRLTRFKHEMDKYKEKYSPDLLNEFFRYYTSLTERGKYKGFMIFEVKQLQGAFNVGGRLATWAKNRQKFSIANLVARKQNQINR